jgi:penicillin amidase
MPAVDGVYADAASAGHQIAGGPAAAGPVAGPVVIAANENAARTNRLKEIFGGAGKYTVDDMKLQQHDVTSWNAEQLVPRLGALHASNAQVEEARGRLVKWDRRIAADSPVAALYVFWEQALWRKISEARVPAAVLDDYLRLAGFNLADAMKASNALLLDALGSAVDRLKTRMAADRRAPSWGALHRVLFTHPLAITQASRRLFNVGPFEPGGYDATVNSYATRSNVDIGASFRQIIDVADWDRSVATSAPGQSEWPRSPHFSDLAKLWAAGEYFPLSFSDRAIQSNTETTLTLQPR